MTCELYACTTPAAAVLITPSGKQLDVCGPHRRVLAERGYEVHAEEATDDE